MLMAVVNLFLTFCRSEHCSPKDVTVSSVSFKEILGMPEVSFKFERMSSKGNAPDTRHRRYGTWDIKDWQRDHRLVQARALLECPSLLNSLADLAKQVKTYCEFHQYDYSTVYLSPIDRGSMTPNGEIRIPLRVMGEVMDDNPQTESLIQSPQELTTTADVKKILKETEEEANAV